MSIWRDTFQASSQINLFIPSGIRNFETLHEVVLIVQHNTINAGACAEPGWHSRCTHTGVREQIRAERIHPQGRAHGFALFLRKGLIDVGCDVRSEISIGQP
jgi:hypothetical protein